MTVEEFVVAARKDGQKIERLIRAFYAQLPSRRVFIDGGAHHGYHTSYAREHFTHRVISIEASPKTYVEHIQGQMRLSLKKHVCEVTPLNCALGSRERQGTMVQFFYSQTHPGRSTVNTKLWDEWGKGSVKYDTPILASVVEIDDIKTLCSPKRNIDFIKLDLEGNEINALRGATSVLLNDKPAIVMEFGLRPTNEAMYGESCEEFVRFMNSLGYALYTPWAERAEPLIIKNYPFWYLFCLPQNQESGNLTDLLARCFVDSLAE